MIEKTLGVHSPKELSVSSDVSSDTHASQMDAIP